MLALLSGTARAERAVTAYASLDASVEEENLKKTLVRLHVVAADDSAEAQALKLQVRDAVLETVRPLLADCDSPALAYARLTASLDDVETAARDCLSRFGCDDPVRAETGVFAFPDCDYDGLSVPAGDYRALRVVIGGGEGHNWWCVLYPSLCRTGDGETYSILAEWLERLLGGEGA